MVPKKLETVLDSSDTVLFVGSGISCWSGLPSWTAIIKKIRDYLEVNGRNLARIDESLSQSDLLGAASAGYAELSKREFADLMREVCSVNNSKPIPNQIHKNISNLGPTCYITTNYDHLIEDALSQWHPDKEFKKVTNRQSMESAALLDNNSKNFVLKYHGDIDDIESIILTSEQYESLYDRNARFHSFYTVQTLLVTRQFVFIGFGLTDPDFLKIVNFISSMFRGGTREHYAFIGNAKEEDIRTYRENYNIHIIPYEVDQNLVQPHQHLGSLLEQLANRSRIKHPSVNSETKSLNLLRYAAKLANLPTKVPFFNQSIKREVDSGRARNFSCLEDSLPSQSFLTNLSENAILIGQIGAGKTEQLKSATVTLAKRLSHSILSNSSTDLEVKVPILIDLKEYGGSLEFLLSKQLASTLKFEEVANSHTIVIYCDSYDEMSRSVELRFQFREQLSALCKAYANLRVLMVSRDSLELSDLQLPVYRLDSASEIEAAIAQNGTLNKDGPRQLRDIQKPFFFSLLWNKSITLDLIDSPLALFKEYFCELKLAAENRFNQQIDFPNLLSPIAKNLMQSGKALFDAEGLFEQLSVLLPSIDSKELVDWLIDQGFIIPHQGRRLAFFHQAIMYYLTANEITKTCKQTPELLRFLFTYEEWDYSLFLALGELAPSLQKSEFEFLLETDLFFCIRATNYIRKTSTDRDFTSMVLEALIKTDCGFLQSLHIERALKYNLFVTAEHSELLWHLIEKQGLIGASAAKHLIQLHGGSIKPRLFKLFLSRADDMHFCIQLGMTLAAFVTESDLPTVESLLKTLEVSNFQPTIMMNATMGLATACSCISEKLLFKKVLEQTSNSLTVARDLFLTEILRHCSSEIALKRLAKLLLLKSNFASAIMFEIAEKEHNPDFSDFGKPHLANLLIQTENHSANNNAYRGIKCLTVFRNSLVLSVINGTNLGLLDPIRAAAFNWATTTSYSQKPFSELSKLTVLSDEEISALPLSFLHTLKLDWSGNEKLFLEIVNKKNSDLIVAILGSIGKISPIFNLDIAWLTDLCESLMTTSKGANAVVNLCEFLVQRLPSKTQRSLISLFNTSSNSTRQILANSLLLGLNDLSMEDFSEDSISYLLLSIGEVKSFPIYKSLLARIADDQFAEARLVPMLTGSTGKKLEELKDLLALTGRKYGRRYSGRNFY